MEPSACFYRPFAVNLCQQFDNVIDNENDNAILRLAIKKLPQDYMDVIHLYYTKDLSAKEISDLLDISNTNVY